MSDEPLRPTAPHLLSVFPGEDGEMEFIYLHLACPVTADDGDCLVDDEFANLGLAAIEGLEPGLYWFRMWTHIHITAHGDEFSTEYDIEPVIQPPLWVASALT